MRTLSVALLALMATAIAQPAAAIEYPWCADYPDDIGGTNCGFTTLAQCRATLSGIGGGCRENPFYRGALVEQQAPARHVKRAPRRER